uniref:MATH domain-containing protein n=1 Tax=Cannabis sativa TaxID=3483 RepID=A0A803PXL1_CANSA
MRRFHELKKEWGFEQIESLETFKDVSNGYLFNDSCAFGADVFVMKHTLNSETLSVFRREDLTNPTFRWEIKEFSKMDKSIISKKFCSGETNWYLWIHPKGESSKNGKALSIFLTLDDDDSAHNNSTIYAEFYLRVIDQLNSKHKEGAANYRWFSGGKGWGFPEFILLEDLHKSSNGYIVKDSLIVEVEFSIMSRTKVSNSKN